MNNRIVIFGASLVGMTLAYFLHEAGFKNITIIEKRKKYTRQQVVLFQPNTYKSYVPKEVRKQLHECFISLIASRLHRTCQEIKENDNPFIITAAIKISDFEKAFLKYIKKFVNVIHSKHTIIDQKNKVVIPQNRSLIPFDILIGADGANSYVRKVIFNDTIIKTLPHNKNYGGYFKFEIKKPKISGFTYFRFLQDFTRGFPQKDQKIYTFNIRLSKKQYNEMKEGKLDKNLFKQVFKIYDLEPKSLTPIDYVVFPINLYRSKRFVKNNTYFLVGDAAITTNFFAGLGANIGIRSALYLTDALLSKNTAKLYTKNMIALSEFSICQSRLNFFDYQSVINLCKKYTKKELMKIVKKNYNFHNRFKNLDKDTICLFLTRTIYQNYYDRVHKECDNSSSATIQSQDVIINKIGGEIYKNNYKFNKEFVSWTRNVIERDYKKLINTLLKREEPTKEMKNEYVFKEFQKIANLVNKAMKSKSPVKFVEKHVDVSLDFAYNNDINVAFDIFKKTKNKYDLFVLYTFISPHLLDKIEKLD